ncbi:MAG TPA: ABC transporter substrate-binding protein [Hyphomicrobiales bacterium]|nr:ABC transporter substrate-binding protein [Hyphomicrobiales bacterium]
MVAIGPARRVVVIGGALTEIAYRLGQQGRIVAVDQTSLYPPEARKKPDVGYMRTLSAEGVLAVRPDLILAIEGSGPATTLDILEHAAVPIVIVPERYTIAGIVGKVRMVGAVFGAGAAAATLADGIAADGAALAAGVAGIVARRRVLFVLSLAGGRILAAGGNTAANAILHLAGAANAVTGFDGYKPLSAEAILAARPDAVLAMSGAGPESITAAEAFAIPALAATPAGRARRLVTMDGLYLLGFGPRTVSAARDLAAALYPGLRLPAGSAG